MWPWSPFPPSTRSINSMGNTAQSRDKSVILSPPGWTYNRRSALYIIITRSVFKPQAREKKKQFFLFLFLLFFLPTQTLWKEEAAVRRCCECRFSELLKVWEFRYYNKSESRDKPLHSIKWFCRAELYRGAIRDSEAWHGIAKNFKIYFD